MSVNWTFPHVKPLVASFTQLSLMGFCSGAFMPHRFLRFSPHNTAYGFFPQHPLQVTLATHTARTASLAHGALFIFILDQCTGSEPSDDLPPFPSCSSLRLVLAASMNREFFSYFLFLFLQPLKQVNTSLCFYASILRLRMWLVPGEGPERTRMRRGDQHHAAAPGCVGTSCWCCAGQQAASQPRLNQCSRPLLDPLRASPPLPHHVRGPRSNWC